LASGENKNEIMDKLKELEASLAKELDQKVRFAEPTDPRLEGHIDVNPNMSEAVEKAKLAGLNQSISSSEKKIMEVASGQVATGAIGNGNPTAAVSQPAVASSQSAVAVKRSTEKAESVEKMVDDITLKDVDDLLNQMDAGFQTSMNEIKNELSLIKDVPTFESIAIGADYLKEAEIEEEGGSLENDLNVELPTDIKAAPVKSDKLMKLTMAAIGAATQIPVVALRATVREIPRFKNSPRDSFFGVVDSILDQTRIFIDCAIDLVKKITGYSAKTYSTMGLFIFLFLAIFFLLRDVYVNFQNADKEKDPFLRNFNEVADSMQVIPEEEAGEDLESPLKHPEYTVLVHRLVANLQAPDRFSNPMVTLELYVEASNQETAVEIHNREAEVKDIIERVLEESNFDDLDTGPGKIRLKIRIRRGLNHILNRGTAKHIMFKTLNIKK